MNKFYLFKISKIINKEYLLNIFNQLTYKQLDVNFINDYTGYFYAEDDLYLVLSNIINNINLDLNVDINIVITHKISDLYFMMLNDSFLFIKNKVISLYELLLTFNLYNFKKYNLKIIEEFSDMPDYLIDTMKMYLEANKNALLTSKNLFIHRNTFNQRLDKFIELTLLDVRDFYNASYFLLYLKIKENYVHGVHNI